MAMGSHCNEAFFVSLVQPPPPLTLWRVRGLPSPRSQVTPIIKGGSGFSHFMTRHQPQKRARSLLPSDSDRYLSGLSSLGIGGVNATDNPSDNTFDDIGIRQESYDDDDYAMSVPAPVGQNTTLVGIISPNEEPPTPESNVVVEGDIVSIYDDSVKNSKFDNLDEISNAAAALSGEDDDTSTGNGRERTKNKMQTQNLRLKSLFANLLGGNNSVKSLKQAERERKWREWMKSGRKVQDASPATTGDLSALDDSLPLVDKGEDYVLVAVPAEVANGTDLGPVLPAFPGVKGFQKTVREFQEVIVNGDVGGGSNVNSTTTNANDKNTSKKKKTPKKTPSPPKKKNADGGKQQTTDDAIARRRKQKYREPGRISANDWRHNIGNMLQSTILRDVRGPVAWVSAWATLWSLFHVLLVPAGPPWVAKLARILSLPTTQHTMMVSAMSFLLVFRTNSAYQRFAEGR